MQLADLKKQWNQLNRREKLEIIESSNLRREQAFEESQKKKRRKSSKKRKKKSRKRSPKTAEGLARLLKDMTPEERENFNLMVQTRMDK